MTRIEKQVTERYCPGCGFLVSQIEIELLRFVVPCPSCEDYNINEFQPVKT